MTVPGPEVLEIEWESDLPPAGGLRSAIRRGVEPFEPILRERAVERLRVHVLPVTAQCVIEAFPRRQCWIEQQQDGLVWLYLLSPLLDIDPEVVRKRVMIALVQAVLAAEFGRLLDAAVDMLSSIPHTRGYELPPCSSGRTSMLGTVMQEAADDLWTLVAWEADQIVGGTKVVPVWRRRVISVRAVIRGLRELGHRFEYGAYPDEVWDWMQGGGSS